MELQDEPLLQGLLLLPPQGMLGQLKKTWHKKFCRLFGASKYGIERLEMYDSQEEVASQHHSPKILTLEACVKIAPSNQPRVFTVVTKTGVHHFGCFTDSDMTSWTVGFQSVAFGGESASQTIEEVNDLYCSSGEGVFSVKVAETEASKRCRLEAKTYRLVIAAMEMKIMDGDDVIYTWPYRYIRRYGYRDGKFTFEAGRKCESGEGSFRLEHSNQQEIFRCVSSKMKSMKKLLNGDNSPSIECNDAQYHAALSMEAGSRSPLPPSGNSSNNLIDIDFTTISQNFQNSQKHLATSSSSSLDSINFIRAPPPIIKPKPAKPPRKYVLTGLLEKKCLDGDLADSLACGKYRKLSQTGSPELSRRTLLPPPPSSVSSSTIACNSSECRDDEPQHPYDLVEVRSDAWRTHGLESVLHTESVDEPERKTEELGESDDRGNANADSSFLDNDQHESGYETITNNLPPSTGNVSWSKRFPEQNIAPIATATTAASPIIHKNVTPKSDSPNYDKLQHFGSMHKLNNNPGYKTPNVSGQSSSRSNSVIPGDETAPPSWSNYDVVADMCAIRLADDTHHGYGIIRKKTNISDTSRATAASPKHKIFNDTEYAIVSKPKRV